MSRATDKRRALAVERALRFFDEATCWFGLSRSYRQICRDRIRKAARPTAAAKAQVRDLAEVHSQRKCSKPETCPDLSAARQARAELWRRHGRRWNPSPHDEILRPLERQLLEQKIDQKAFNKLCSEIVEKPLPAWMAKYVVPEVSLRPPRLPAAVLHRILGFSEPESGEDTSALTAIPAIFNRNTASPDKHAAAPNHKHLLITEDTEIREAKVIKKTTTERQLEIRPET